MTGPYRLPDVPPPRLKQHRRYLAYRVYAVAVAVGWNALAFSQMVAALRSGVTWRLADFLARQLSWDFLHAWRA